MVCHYKNTVRIHFSVVTGEQLNLLVAVLNGLKKVSGAYSCGLVVAGHQTLLEFYYADSHRRINVTLGEIGCSFLTNGKLQMETDGESIRRIGAL